jgi:hypothetical protein
MKDRFGHSIQVGWPPHHILWIEAAMTLPHAERIAAFQDIGEMTGRGYASVYYKHRHILRERAALKKRLDLAARSQAYQAGRPEASRA